MVLTAARHEPVLVDRVTELLRPHPGGTYLDATLGLGGHTERLLEASAPDGRVVGLDRDPAALALASARLAWAGDRLQAVAASFEDLAEVAGRLGLEAVDGVLYDLGVSSMQLDRPERGFSYRADGPLDMRMGPNGERAMDIVNSASEEELARIVFEYGEERRSRRVAAAIVRARSRSPIETTDELAGVVASALGARRGGPHPARRTFQALRIAVNRELEELTASLPRAVEILAPGGRVVVIAYHSLEDRIVKRFFNGAEDLEVLTRKPLRPSPAESAMNPRSRSAKLRCAERSRAA